MLPDNDRRHGTPAGRKAGCDCRPCVEAHKRRCKEYNLRAQQMGGSTLVDASRARNVLAETHKRMSYSAIARELGTAHTWVRAVVNGKIQRISPAREAAVLRLRAYWPTDSSHVAALGPMRRLQALHAFGYSWTRLAEETGYSLSGLKSVAHGQWEVIEAHNAQKIREVYERLSMTIPTSDNQYVKSGIQRARNNGRIKGWPVPMAWDNPDNPREMPKGERDDRNSIDEVAVLRVLAGDFKLRLNRPERLEVLRRWSGSDAELERATGWNVPRMRRETAQPGKEVA